MYSTSGKVYAAKIRRCFTNPVRALEAIYVVSTPRAGGCKFGKRNRLGVKRNIYDQLRYVTELR